VLFADFDNDGHKDLFVSSGIVKRPLDLDFVLFFANLRDPSAYGGADELQRAMLEKMPDGSSHPYFFRGAESGGPAFVDVSEACGTAGLKGYFNGAAYADLDNDGRLDLVINCLNAPAVVLRNAGPRRQHCSPVRILAAICPAAVLQRARFRHAAAGTGSQRTMTASPSPFEIDPGELR